MSLAQVEHTDTGLSDPSSNCIREFPAEERFLEIQFGTFLAAGKSKLAFQRSFIESCIKNRVVDDNIAV